MKNKCCKYHNNFNYKDVDLTKCGMARRGAMVLCCKNCPVIKWYNNNQPTRPIGYYTDAIVEGWTNEVPF